MLITTLSARTTDLIPPSPPRRLMATASLDCSIRFWDVDATPHPLIAPEGGHHVRVGPALYAPMRPEWTTTNPPFVNCLTLQTAGVPICLAPMSEWVGPEGMLVLTRHFGGRTGGTLNMWGVTRTTLAVEACRFDEPIHREQSQQIEAVAAQDWRNALHRVQSHDAGYSKLIDEERGRREQCSIRTLELLAHAALMRPSLDTLMVEASLQEVSPAPPVPSVACPPSSSPLPLLIPSHPSHPPRPPSPTPPPAYSHPSVPSPSLPLPALTLSAPTLPALTLTLRSSG